MTVSSDVYVGNTMSKVKHHVMTPTSEEACGMRLVAGRQGGLPAHLPHRCLPCLPTTPTLPLSSIPSLSTPPCPPEGQHYLGRRTLQNSEPCVAVGGGTTTCHLTTYLHSYLGQVGRRREGRQ